MLHKNILLIFTDQQRFDTLEGMGNRIIKTPSLNRLVKKGITFTRAYTPCPVCIPARYSMHTGLLPHKTDCLYNETASGKHKSFMQVLHQSGYQTHGVGKMHFDMQGEHWSTLWGFEKRDLSEECGTYDDFKKHLNKNGYEYVEDVHGVRSDMYYIPQPSQLPQRLHNTTWVTDKSIDFLEGRDQSRPFMLMTSFIKPHPPFESPTPWNKLYRGPEMPLPKMLEDNEGLITFWNRFQNKYKYKDRGRDYNLIRQIKAAYYSAISFVDYNVGRLLDYMEENNLLENTLIIFTSDHGEMLGDYGCFGKRNFLDSASRIPMIMCHPDIEGDKLCEAPVNLVDVYPTILNYAEIRAHKNCDGYNLCDIYRNENERDITFGQYHRGEYAMYMAVSREYKYIYSAPDQKEWLFDLTDDPLETTNKAYNPIFINNKNEMKKKLIEKLMEDGYLSPFEGDDWKLSDVKQLNSDPDAYLLFQDTPKSIPHIAGYERDRNAASYEDDLYKMGF